MKSLNTLDQWFRIDYYTAVVDLPRETSSLMRIVCCQKLYFCAKIPV